MEFPTACVDPYLALYSSAGVLVLDGLFPARNDDIASANLNAQLFNIPLSGGTTYLLALTQAGNIPQESLVNCTPAPNPGDPPTCTGGFDFGAVGFECFTTTVGCTVGGFGGLAANFALDLELAPAITAVPEPGTLSLLALGSACAGLAGAAGCDDKPVDTN